MREAALGADDAANFKLMELERSHLKAAAGCCDSCYSYRKAINGSMRIARRAGM